MTKNVKSTEPGITYFVTFTVVEWLNVFTKPEYLQILWESLQYCRKEKGLKLYGFVFMTNHLHLIISADPENIKLWQIIRDFKKYTAQKIIQVMQKKENRLWILDVMRTAGKRNNANTQYQFWIQDDCAEEISTEKFFLQKLNYLHGNPVRAEIVANSCGYAWSSARLYEKDDFSFIDRIEL
ncbi:MAG: transposase [Smithellaceae bacterium]